MFLIVPSGVCTASIMMVLVVVHGDTRPRERMLPMIAVDNDVSITTCTMECLGHLTSG